MEEDEKLKSIAGWYLEIFLTLPKKVQELILINNIRQKIYPSVLSEKIESPIEQIFITAFELYIMFNKKKDIFLFSQKEIIANGKKYVVDFYFEEDENVNKFNTDKKIIIECDGYEFHQKTKEQVQKDNEREYNLKMEGYEILRFSGTQIYNNPFKCAEDTYNYIIKRIGE